MFRAGTVFIIGAGASKEVGLPLGDELKGKIANVLDLPRSNNLNLSDRTSSGDIIRALHTHAINTGKHEWQEHFNALRKSCRFIRDNVLSATSIDHFLNQHQGNQSVELCGKLAIARIIIEAEKTSQIAASTLPTSKTLQLEHLSSTWFGTFFKRLTEEVSKADVAKIFNNVAFIIFNYDRCVEHFLFHAIRQYYDLHSTQAADILNTLEVCHPYGTIGNLPWRTPPGHIDFGNTGAAHDLLAIVPNLRTFSEGAHSDVPTTVKRFVDNAAQLVFLGCGFHRETIKILKNGRPQSPTRILATSSGISPSDRDSIRSELRIAFRCSHEPILDLTATCARLFDSYSRMLTAD